MAQERNKPSAKAVATIERLHSGEVVLLAVSGLVDEHFTGFGVIPPATKAIIINTTGLTRMTSFGVRQWLAAMDALPKRLSDVYLLGCPSFFVDQLNMVVNFGGTGKVLTILAPYICAACGHDSSEIIDVLAGRATLVKGEVPDMSCPRCNEQLELDETPESYFAFVNTYAASTLSAEAAQLLAAQGLYTAAPTNADKPPKILKVVHGGVTYFRITGTIGSQFRARPIVVGAEGEVVLDLGKVDRCDALGQPEWNKLMKSLAANVRAVTLVDIGPSILTEGGIQFDKTVFVWSVLVPYGCTSCDRTTNESITTLAPAQFPDRICSACGGAMRAKAGPSLLAPLEHASFDVPTESAALIRRRDEMLSRAIVDARVAEAAESATPVMEDESIFGKYQIVRRLSAGGMAEVFLAKQLGIGGFEKPVALKRIQRQLLERRHLAIDMFLNEAKIAARLTHPNIVQVLDVGEAQGALFLAMEYVHGRDFHELLKRLRTSRTRMPLAEACFIVREVALALHHAYFCKDMDGKQLSVVHRDVSPHNIILGFDGTVKLLDFGVAMSSVTEGETMVVGKWMYMSPEHTTNLNVDHRSDLFSLGVVLYQACTGKSPFASTNAKDTVRKIRQGDYVPVQEHARVIPNSLATLIHRLMSPEPSSRPQHGQEVAAMLNEIAREPGLESSGQHMSRLMMHLFPEHATLGLAPQPIETDPTQVMDTGLALQATGAGQTPEPQPKPGTSTSLSRVDLDFSVSLVPKPQAEESVVSSPVFKPTRSSALVTTLQILGVLLLAAILIYLTLWQ